MLHHTTVFGSTKGLSSRRRRRGSTVFIRVLIRRQRQAQIELIQSQVMEMPTTLTNADDLIAPGPDIDSKEADMEWTV